MEECCPVSCYLCKPEDPEEIEGGGGAGGDEEPEFEIVVIPQEEPETGGGYIVEEPEEEEPEISDVDCVDSDYCLVNILGHATSCAE